MSRAEIKGRISMDAKGVKVGTDAAGKHVSGFQKKLGSLRGTMAAAFSAGAIAAFGKSVLDLGGQISDFAFQTGMGTDAFQAFNSVAMDGGASMQEVRKGLISIRDAQYAALAGEKMYMEAFEALGITLEDLANKSMENLLQAVAEGHKATGDFGALVDLVGRRNAASLEEALIKLAENGFGAVITDAKRAGDVIDGDLIPKMDAAADRIDKLKLKSKTYATIASDWALRDKQRKWGIKKNFFSGNNEGGWNPWKRFQEAVKKTAEDMEAADAEAIEKAAGKREKNLTREFEQRKKLLDKQTALEDAAQAEKNAKELAGLRKKIDRTVASGSFDAADSLARIGGKVGGQADNLERQVAEQTLYTRQILEHLKTRAPTEPLKLVGG